MDRETALEQQLAAQALNQRLAALRAQDRGFDPQEFLERAQSVVLAMAAACRKGTLDGLQEEIFEGRYATWKAGFMDTVIAQELAGENLTVDAIAVTIVSLGLSLSAIINQADPGNAAYDAITVRVDAHSDAEEPFTEYWIFIRRAGALAGAPGPQTGQCPNCGAPLSPNPLGTCVYCGAALGMHADSAWTLAEITNIQLPLG